MVYPRMCVPILEPDYADHCQAIPRHADAEEPDVRYDLPRLCIHTIALGIHCGFHQVKAV